MRALRFQSDHILYETKNQTRPWPLLKPKLYEKNHSIIIIHNTKEVQKQFGIRAKLSRTKIRVNRSNIQRPAENTYYVFAYKNHQNTPRNECRLKMQWLNMYMHPFLPKQTHIQFFLHANKRSGRGNAPTGLIIETTAFVESSYAPEYVVFQ